MKNIFKFNYSILIILAIMTISYSCSDSDFNEISNDTTEQTSSKFLENLDFESNETIVITFEEENLNSILGELVDKIYDYELKISRNKSLSNDIGFVGSDVFIGGDEIIITPFSGSGSSNSSNNDVEKCGGEESDGWKFNGSCSVKKCINETMSEASDNVKLKSGQCLTFRVKKLSGNNANVCSKIESC